MRKWEKSELIQKEIGCLKGSVSEKMEDTNSGSEKERTLSNRKNFRRPPRTSLSVNRLEFRKNFFRR